MRKKPPVRITVASLMIGLVLCISTSGLAQKPVVIKMATLAPEGSSWMRIITGLTDEIAEKTGNAVTFRIYAGGVLGDEKDILRKMNIGQIQAAALTSSGLSAIVADMDVFQIPFLFNSYEETDYVVDKLDGILRNQFEAKGYDLLGWSEGGFVYLMSTTPIDSLETLRKTKVWTWADSPMAKAIFDEAGVSAIPLSVPDVLVGLQTGLIDVVYAPPSGAIAMQWFTKTKYITDIPLIYLLGGVVVKHSVMESISADHRQVMQELFDAHMARLKTTVRQENKDAMQVMQKHGMQLVTPSAEQVQGFKTISDRAMQRMHGHTFSPKIREQVNSYLSTFRRENQ
jgi:TRAP-type C4-dicarboxylate transport system substrate-binding protein